MASTDYPPFTEAEDRYLRFLRSLGHPGTVEWIGAHEVAMIGRSILVRPSSPAADHREAAREQYASAKGRGLGVLFDLVASSATVSYSHVWVPQDEGAASRALMPDGLKLSASEPARRARVVRGRLAWCAVRYLSRRWQGHLSEGVFLHETPS